MTALPSTARSLFVIVLSSFSCILLAQSQAVARTIHYVDNLGDCAAAAPCHATIMDAVGAAAPSDSIEVFPGVYHEAVVFGAGKDDVVLRARSRWLMPVIAAPPGAENAITLLAPGVQVLHFVLEAPEGAGVRNNGLIGATRAAIRGNRIKAAGGITLQGCRSSAVKDNWILRGGINVIHSTGDCSFEGNTVDGASIQLGAPDIDSIGNMVRRNLVRGGDILFHPGDPLLSNTVESNRVEAGSIVLWGWDEADGNLIRHNVVRGGGIQLNIARAGHPLGSNTIEANFVSGSSGDGIAVQAVGGQSLVRRNTSVENAGCDVNDTASSAGPRNTWRNNWFGTQCGAATE